MKLSLKKHDRLKERSPAALRAHIKSVEQRLGAKEGSVDLNDIKDVSKQLINLQSITCKTTVNLIIEFPVDNLNSTISVRDPDPRHKSVPGIMK